MRTRFLLPLLGALGLSACAAVPTPSSSYIGSAMSNADAGVIAAAITSFVQTHVPAASSTVAIDPATVAIGSDLTSPLPGLVTSDIRKAGYGVAAPGVTVPGAHTVRYLVTPLNGGLLLRVAVDQAQGAQVFGTTAQGMIAAASPVTQTGTVQ